jgi:hypothetical protein
MNSRNYTNNIIDVDDDDVDDDDDERLAVLNDLNCRSMNNIINESQMWEM